MATDVQDIFIIGGGVNGCGIARDAAGRGLSVVLAEMNDLASATSSASTKLFHGGLRYLEYYEFRLVKEALREREVLLRNMPHISWPMRFVLPYHKGLRPAWILRIGLMMYDYLGGRKILPPTRTLDLRTDPAGRPLKDSFTKAFEYSDCWVQDSRLVVLNARDAQARGAKILTRTKVISAERGTDHWDITVESGGETQVYHARLLINAGGPWVEDIIRNTIRINSTEGVRLVRGSHIVTKKLFDNDRSYIFQGADNRVIFAIPYEGDYTVIGTTDQDHTDANTAPVCTDEEADYLRKFASEYFKTPIEKDDIVWRYSGVRPLYDDGASSATEATRDYVLSLNEDGVPLLSVFGGKITTYRKLSESVMGKIGGIFPNLGKSWTADAPMPGGDFPHDGVQDKIDALSRDYPFLGAEWATRLVRTYGTEAWDVLGAAKTAQDLGEMFGATLCAAEVDWLVKREFAQTAEDILWRRTRLGLRIKDAAPLEQYLAG
ncbi:MAG: glycerol-3-phosphate dehydrogenase [Rhodobacterales bacterium]|nr:glycerol-3-phosphate dehydrogenase [Rhodobacterales bacterium]